MSQKALLFCFAALASAGGMTKRKRNLLIQIGVAVAGLTVMALIGLSGARGVRADDDDEGAKVQRGFLIAPVPLNLAGKDRALVGLGSYIVNAQADCNGCHSSGAATEFLPNGNPYLLSPPLGPFTGKKTINPATYLGGNRDFGAYPAAPFPHIISRNLTPDKTGLPEGGHTLAEFKQIIRTGVDMDHLHPTCTHGPDGQCIPAPFDGSRLQIMPWPIYQDMTDHDLEAIYEYLKAIPCVAGPPAPDPRHNDCH